MITETSVGSVTTTRTTIIMTAETSDHELTILVCSANLGNAEPSLQDMAAWIPTKGKCNLVTPLSSASSLLEQKDSFDLLAIGMQESTWSAGFAKRASSTMLDETETSGYADASNSNIAEEEDAATDAQDAQDAQVLQERTKKDISKLAALLDSTLGQEYKLIAETQRGQMRLVLMGRHALAADLTDLKITGENTGVAHVLANKGGIVMSLTYRQTTRLSFVSCHLAAHEGDSYYAARCDNVVEILQGAKTHDRYDVTLSSHHVFLLGDLNFRTRFPPGQLAHQSSPDRGGSSTSLGNNGEKKTSASVERAMALIEAGNFKELYRYDELEAGLARKDLLSGFETLPCHFSPTFKVLRQDGFTYKQQRTPSYTDRILYRSATPGFLKPLAYEPCPQFTSSDHKPIRGAFSITPNDAATPADSKPTCSYHLKFRNMSCTNLPDTDLIGKSDPYIMLTWDYIQIASDREHRGNMRWTSPLNKHWPKTKFIPNTLNPVFKDVQLNLYLNGPVGPEALLYVTLMDYDMNSKDDLMATLPLDLRQLVSQEMTEGKHKTQTATVELDRPLLKDGKESGRIKLTIDIEKSDTPISIDDRSKHTNCCSALLKLFCC